MIYGCPSCPIDSDEPGVCDVCGREFVELVPRWVNGPMRMTRNGRVDDEQV